MIDQDLPFTYIQNPRPAYRWPLSLANYAFYYSAGLGLVVLLFEGRKTPARLYAAGAALLGLACVAVYMPSPSRTDSRFRCTSCFHRPRSMEWPGSRDAAPARSWRS